MAEAANQGQAEAHTPGETAGNGAAAPISGADPAAILDGLPFVTRGDLLEAAADITASERRGRGRPAGSPNRKNKEMIAFLEARGIRDPWLTLAIIQSADTIKLADMLAQPLWQDGAIVKHDGKTVMVRADPLKVLALQKSAAEAILAYHHAKQPQQLDLPDLGNTRPMMVIGEMNVSIEALAGEFMSAGEVVEKAQQNQSVIDAEPCDGAGDSLTP